MQLLLVLLYTVLAESANDEFLPSAGVENVCPGDMQTYTCNIVGGGNTMWSGTAFNCPTKSNEIILRHSQFGLVTVFGNCNGGTIAAQSLGVNSNCYSSQLNVTIDSDMDNDTIQCVHISNTRTATIGVVTFSVATVPSPPPARVQLAKVHPGKLVFNWTSERNGAVNLYYSISSTCGDCPTNVTATTVTCSNIRLSTMCTFSVRSVVCGTIGDPSLPVAVTLQVPDAPNVFSVVPQYILTNKQEVLTTIIVFINQTATQFSITDTISGSITNYSVNFYSISSKQTSAQTVFACTDDICEYVIDVPPSICSSATNINISTTASNILGQGAPSDPIMIGCDNQFVNVKYNSTTSTISCIFENQSDFSMKICSLKKYGICGQEMDTIQSNTTNGFIVTLMLDSIVSARVSNQAYCYIVTAANGTHQVLVNGSIDMSLKEGSANTAIIAAIVVPILIIVMLVIAAVGVILGVRSYGGKSIGDPNKMEMEEKKPTLSSLHLVDIHSKHFTVSTASDGESISTFCTKNNIKGKVIFLQHKVGTEKDSIEFRDIVIEKKNNELCTGPVAREMVRDGQDLTTYAECKHVFILPSDSIYLNGEAMLTSVVLHQDDKQRKNKFEVHVVNKKIKTVSDFIQQDRPISPFELGRVFYEFLSNQTLNLQHYVEVICINVSGKTSKKDSEIPQTSNEMKTVKLKAAASAQRVVELESGIHFFYNVLKAPGDDIKHPGKAFKIFIQCTSDSGSKTLKAGSFILYKFDTDGESHRTQLSQ